MTCTPVPVTAFKALAEISALTEIFAAILLSLRQPCKVLHP